MDRMPRRALPMARLSILLLVLPFSTKASEALEFGSVGEMLAAKLLSAGAASA